MCVYVVSTETRVYQDEMVMMMVSMSGVLERTSINKLLYELCVDCALTYTFSHPKHTQHTIV